MRLRLTHYEGSPPSLSPGWYEVPSHVPGAEIARLLDLLAVMLGDVVDIVQCSWLELERFGAGFGAGTLVHVAIMPREVDVARRDATLRGLSPRLGLFSHARVGQRETSAWLETTIKSALAAWLRRTLRRGEHPLAALGVGALPLDTLIAATSEPIELLELVEQALALALEQALDGDPIDWTLAARKSLGRRLIARLHRARAVLVPELLRLLAQARAGTLRRLDGPQGADELVRIGLGIGGEGEVLLAPLARLAVEPDIAAMLAHEGFFAGVAIEPPPERARATSPAAAVHAFDPNIEIGLDDPWFVDLDAVSPALRGLGLRLRHALVGREDHARVALVVPRGFGVRTMLTKWVRELEARGLVVVRVPFEGRTDQGVVEVLLAMHVALLEHALGDELPEREQSKLEATLRFLRGNLARSGSGSLATMLSEAEQEAMVDEHLVDLAEDVQAFAERLRQRGRSLCMLVAKGASHELFRALSRRPLQAHVVVEIDTPTLAGGVESLEASEASFDERRDMLEAVLSARAELARVFVEPAAALAQLVGHTSRIDRALAIAQRACVAGEGLVSVEQLARAAPLRLLYLWGAPRNPHDGVINFEEEQERLITGLEREPVELVIRPITSLARLGSLLFGAEPDILHLSGVADVGRIILPSGEVVEFQSLLAHVAGGLRHRARTPRLIVVATSDAESMLEPLAALADIAIGFCRSIHDDAARESMLAFYERALAGAPLDAALARAREVAERMQQGAGEQLLVRTRPGIDATYVLSAIAQQPE